MAPAPAPSTPNPDRPALAPIDSAAPSTGARVLALLAIVVGGACGGLIGYAIADLQCTGDCSIQRGIGAVGGALAAAVGVAVVAVLVLRAMGEWRTIQHRRPDPRR